MTKNLRKPKYINLVIKKINEPAKRKFHFTIPYSIQYSHIIMSRKLEKNNSSVLWIPLGNFVMESSKNTSEIWEKPSSNISTKHTPTVRIFHG